MKRQPSMTEDEIRVLPESPGLSGRVVVTTDPLTGQSTYERTPMQFMVRRDDVYCYTFRDGTQWRIVEDGDGTRYKERIW